MKLLGNQDDTRKDNAPGDRIEVSKVIRRAFGIYIGNPTKFILPMAIIGVPLLVERMIYIGGNVPSKVNSGFGSLTILSLALILISLVPFIYYEITVPVMTVYILSEEDTTLATAFAWVRKKSLFWGVVLVTLLFGLVFMGGLLLLIVPGFIFAAWFMLAVPARILGNHSGVQALSESRRLMRPVLMRGGLLLAILIFVPSLIVSYTFRIWSTIFGYNSMSAAAVIPPAIISYLFAVLWVPVTGLVLSLVYFVRSGGSGALRNDIFINEPEE